MKAPLFWSVVAPLAFVGSVLAQASDPWIGKRVFTLNGVVPRLGGRVPDDEGRSRSIATPGKDRSPTRIYVVHHSNGEWLWLDDEKSGASGWVQSKQVVPYTQAIDHFSNLIRSDPSADLYNQRGYFRLAEGEHEAAIADFDEAIRSDPGKPTYLNSRGTARLAQKDYDRAVADFEGAIRLDPKDASARGNRGLARLAKKDYGGAAADFDEAIRLDPKDAMAYGSLAWLLATCPDERYRDGKRAVEMGIKAYAMTGWRDGDNLGNLAAAYAESGDFEKAVELQERALNLSSGEAKKKRGQQILDGYREKKPYRDTD